MAGLTWEELMRGIGGLSSGNPNMPMIEVGPSPITPRAPVAAQPAARQPMQQPAAAQPEQPGGIKGFFSDKDRRARLAIALEGMTMNPNNALIGEMQRGIETRAQKQERNATMEWLKSRGRDDLAEAMAGGLPAADAMRMALAPPAQAEQTSLMQNVRWLMDQGIPMERAIDMARGGTTVNVGDQGPKLVGTEGLVAVPDQASATGFRFEVAPGSPLEAKTAQEQADAVSAAETQSAALAQGEMYKSETVRAAERAIEMIGKTGPFDIIPEAGKLGALLAASPIPLPGGQEATDLRNTLATVQAGIAFDRLQSMRDASKTGGALGGVSEREIDLLMSSLGALQQNSSPALLKENLANIVRIMTKIENDPIASAAYAGRSMPAASAPGGDDALFYKYGVTR